VILCRIALSLLGCAAWCADYYVAPQGDDAHDGSIDRPWATLQAAVERIAPGDTIIVRAGVYAGFRASSAGREDARLTIRAAPDEHVILRRPGPRNRQNSIIEIENFAGRANYWVVEGFEVAGSPRHGIDLRNADFVVVRGNRVHGSRRTGIFTGFSESPLIEWNECWENGEHGVYHSNSADNPVIRGNWLHHNFAAGIHFNGDVNLQPGDGQITGALVEDNVIWANGRGGGSGINCDGLSDSLIRNNLLYFNFASGISLYAGDGAEGSSRNRVYHNTIVMAPGSRWVINIPASTGKSNPVGNVLRNNILWTPRANRGSILAWSAARDAVDSDNNVVVDRFRIEASDAILTLAAWQATGNDALSLPATTTGGIFVDADNADLRLRPGSPAIDRGAKLDSVPTDIEGRPRPQGAAADAGCFEWSDLDRL
jgi:parallel beta-helix repeat protein